MLQNNLQILNFFHYIYDTIKEKFVNWAQIRRQASNNSTKHRKMADIPVLSSLSILKEKNFKDIINSIAAAIASTTVISPNLQQSVQSRVIFTTSELQVGKSLIQGKTGSDFLSNIINGLTLYSLTSFVFIVIKGTYMTEAFISLSILNIYSKILFINSFNLLKKEGL